MNYRKKIDASSFIIKTSGGIASQLLGLISAIHISKKLNKPFKIKHYPYSTGGFYPIAIRDLLDDQEIYDLFSQVPGMKDAETANVGAILENHPLVAKKFSYMHLINHLTRLGLSKYMNILRLEWQVNTSESRLKAAPPFLRSVSGGYPPFYSDEIESDLKNRFKKAGKNWPFGGEGPGQTHPDVVIHFRLGDKRTAYSKPGIGGAVNAIIDPASFKEILDLIPEENKKSIYVISDEPQTAVLLLAEAGIKALQSDSKGDIWLDMELMSAAKILICPCSSVSQLIATFASQQPDKKIYYPESPGRAQKILWKLDNVNYYKPQFLGKDHPVYREEYSSSMENGASYLLEDR